MAPSEKGGACARLTFSPAPKSLFSLIIGKASADHQAAVLSDRRFVGRLGLAGAPLRREAQELRNVA
jgi:hypothetical protein